MHFVSRLLSGVLAGMLMVVSGCSFLNSYQTSGKIGLSGLTEAVKVIRDGNGTPYIYAENTGDALTALGFVTAQDRLFQMEAIRLIAAGRIAELVGDKGKELDAQMRTLGFARLGRTHATILAPTTRDYLQRYADGINAYIDRHADSHHLEFRLAGIQPARWEIADSLSILYLMSWRSSANIRTEVIAQMLIEKLGYARAAEIFPININPDDTETAAGISPQAAPTGIDPGLWADIAASYGLSPGPFEIGSNNWVVSGSRSVSGKPIVANDPHLDARILPGPWYPAGLFTPDLRVVGVGIPGLPGMVIFRNDHVAVGVTNAYTDCQDLYIETLDPDDPDRYLEGGVSVPFDTVVETLKIKDGDAPGGFREEELRVRYTRRGPVITGNMPYWHTDQIISVRWAPAETMAPELGLENLMNATSAQDLRRALAGVRQIALNFVFADTQGNVGWQVSGQIPIRAQGESSVPFKVVSEADNWIGWIPADQMPGHINPARGWTGTCNHNTTPAGYPYYTSSYYSASYRYRRLKQIMASASVTSADDHWRYQRDTLNLMAASIAPLIANALNDSDETRDLATLLRQWDFHDDPQLAAPLIFQSIYREFARLVYRDELGEELTEAMLRVWYFWQERLHRMVLTGDASWFDDRNTTDVVETRDQLFRQAAVTVRENLRDRYGSDPSTWKWGEAHRMTFVSPIRREGFGKGLLGGGSHPAGGSGETLYRGLYDFKNPFDVILGASLRMVADLGDDEKILAVLPGGVTGRVFHPHATDQIGAFMDGEKQYWWFSDAAIAAHSESELVLMPE